MNNSSRFLRNAEWLLSNLQVRNLVILDASMTPVAGSRNANQVGLIPKSIRFDMKNELSDQESRYDNTLLNREEFVEKMQLMGIRNDSTIVIYDTIGIYSSPRAYYMIKDFGHENVFVLEGGLPSWININGAVDSNYRSPEERGDFTDRGTNSHFCGADHIVSLLEDSVSTLFDARSTGRYNGIDPEPRANLKSGRIPSSVNLPFEKVLDVGKFKSQDELKHIFDGFGVIRNPVFSCGSGVTSCIVAMAAEMIGIEKVKIYDGSWSEWGDENNNFPIEK